MIADTKGPTTGKLEMIDFDVGKKYFERVPASQENRCEKGSINFVSPFFFRSFSKNLPEIRLG